MTTSELISYIRNQIQNNISKDLIISKLESVGWHRSDIDEGFLSIDQYREPVAENIPNEAPVENLNSYNIKKESNELVIQNIELPKIEAETHAEIKKETPKIWTPMSVPIKEKSYSSSGLNTKKESNELIVQNIELSKEEDKIPERRPLEDFNKKPIVINPKFFDKGEEIITPITPKPVINSFGSINNKDNLSKVDTITPVEEAPKASLTSIDLPKIAMLSSYKNDLMSLNKQKEVKVLTSGGSKKWIIVSIIVIILSLLGFAFASGYINIKNFNILAIKKDPKVLLLNNSKVLASLKSYKTETNIEISSPSVADISSGLLSGEAVTSTDKDTVSINTLGVINQNDQGLLSDNFITIKSSLLPDYITTDVKSNGTDLFVSVPDLKQILADSTPESSIVKINEQQFELIPGLFSKDVETELKKINIYKILSSGMPSYINKDTLSAYDNLVNNVEIIEKGVENIKGIDTYHYSINVDRQLSKKLLGKIADDYSLNLSQDDKNNLDQILGSISVDSFDVWVGKGDNNIYQYNVVLNVPLSKVIGFEDKSIGDNTIKVSWKTTYYDFDISNNLFMPVKFIPISDFISNFKKLQTKNEVSSFKQLATNLFTLEKSYGSKSNTLGSCMSPVSGSLFSPTGHSKNSTVVISSISTLLNKILGKTNGIGYCSSTSKDWSFTVPISDNYDPAITTAAGYTSFYCVDSTGAKENLTALPIGVVCAPKVVVPKTTN